ncbi:hypothetical protein [Acidocella aminolytica]|uniref:hypothetical protein n=2 Tax=Acidocella aminolytica TaxID=33998 RepID=UPI0009321B83|nr:hypothetical protein [Acidocella aminolytica]
MRDIRRLGLNMLQTLDVLLDEALAKLGRQRRVALSVMEFLALPEFLRTMAPSLLCHVDWPRGCRVS